MPVCRELASCPDGGVDERESSEQLVCVCVCVVGVRMVLTEMRLVSQSLAVFMHVRGCMVNRKCVNAFSKGSGVHPEWRAQREHYFSWSIQCLRVCVCL